MVSLKKLLKRVKTVFSLERDEKLLCIEIALLLIKIRLRMFFSPFSSVLAWAKKNAVLSEKQRSSPVRIAWFVESIGSVFPVIFKCLSRALAGFIIMRRCGWDVSLKIGTRRKTSGNPLEAHAWLEQEGVILVGNIAGIVNFAVFESFGGKFL